MTLSHPSVPVILLVLGVILEVVFWTMRCKRPGTRLLEVVRYAAWFMRPVMVAAVANLWLWRSGMYLSCNVKTYPFYANPCPGDGVWDMLRIFFAGAGVPLWLPIAVLAGLLFTGAAVALRTASVSYFRWRWMVPALTAIIALALAFWIAIGSLPQGLFTKDGQDSSFLAPWHDAGTTMLYAAQFMKPDAAGYLRNFKRIQARLNHVIHAKSHPPFASLATRWIGAAAGVDVNNGRSYRDAHARLRYALGQTVVSSLNLVLIFFLGMVLFDRKTGMLATVLWGVAPSVSHYASFAPDMNYALFFHGALIFSWLVVTGPDRRHALEWSVPLGLCFAALVLLNFSWCIATAFFAAFALVVARREGRTWRDTAWRVVPPLTLMVLASGVVMIIYHIDYLTIYRNSSAFVNAFYPHHSLAAAILALIGGQVEWLFLAGPLVSAGFFAFLRTARRLREWPLQRLFAWTLLGILVIPFVFGPSALKHEVARCWIWVVSVPAVFAARFWMTRGGGVLFGVVALSSAALSVIFRFFFLLNT